MKFLNFTKIKIFGCFLLVFILAGCADTDSMSYALKAYKNKTAAQILAESDKALAKKNYDEASKGYEALDALFPFAPETKKGQLEVIYAYYKNADYTSSLVAADRYIHLYPRDNAVAYVYYMKGMANLDSSENWLQKLTHSDPSALDLKGMRTAFSSFNELIQEFPDSIYALNAQKQMIFIRNLLAQHEVEVAEFYFSHKAYIAAINRASYVVQHLDGAPQVIKALKIMYSSYFALGDKDKANEVERILVLNDPMAKNN